MSSSPESSQSSPDVGNAAADAMTSAAADAMTSAAADAMTSAAADAAAAQDISNTNDNVMDVAANRNDCIVVDSSNRSSSGSGSSR
jgi:hypothetical protein